MIKQRDIVEIVFNGDIENHPVIVLSNNLIHEVEQAFVCVLGTSKDVDDEFSFVIDSSMLSKPMKKPHYEARCHMIQLVPISAIITNTYNVQMKLAPFKNLIKKINATTFSTDEL